jgi:hypothetical protein
MTINDNTFAFTSWLVRNTHVETEAGLTERDGYKWYNYMWEKWLHNSDMGRTIINDMMKNNNINNNNSGTTTNMSNPRSELDTVTFTFIQETNCVDGPSNDIETLTVEAKSSLGIDGDGGAFYVLRTQQWAVDGADEINELVKRCEKAIVAMVK